ncbi:peptidyl-prolyl cis-trans isomerase [candidate division KSB1 bacterium]|nr:peptidyl-prolyl cis-trans isomerase [candidate division KSB1 bacterium]
MNHQKYIIIFSITVLLSAQPIHELTSAENEFSQHSMWIDPEIDHSAIVARVGEIDITAGEFYINYEFGPAFFKRASDSKRRYLNVMIYEKLLALDGYAHGLALSPQVQDMLAAIEGDLMTEQLFRDDVMSHVNVTDKEIAEGVDKNNQHITLQWIFTHDMQAIISDRRALDAGASFDSLFVMQLDDSLTADKRSLETTRFKIQIDNPFLSTIIDTMKVGTYSNPINVKDGWYIVKISAGWTNAMQTESELRDQRYEIERKLFKHKLDRQSDSYVHKMMLDENPIIKRAAFDNLINYLGKQTLRPEKYDAWNLADYMNGSNDSNAPDLNQLLATCQSGDVTVEDFLDWYNMRKDYFHFENDSRDSFRNSLEATIWKMLRNRFLIERARQQQLQNRDDIQLQKQWWLDKIVYAAMKDEIAATIDVTDEQLQQFYQENQNDYRCQNGNFISFDKAKINVKSDYIRQAYMTKMYRQILQLKNQYPIEINDDVLAQIQVSDEDNPKAIDVYFVKKGGTFPHQAHPTIDWEWRSWF